MNLPRREPANLSWFPRPRVYVHRAGYRVRSGRRGNPVFPFLQNSTIIITFLFCFFFSPLTESLTFAAESSPETDERHEMSNDDNKNYDVCTVPNGKLIVSFGSIFFMHVGLRVRGRETGRTDLYVRGSRQRVPFKMLLVNSLLSIGLFYTRMENSPKTPKPLPTVVTNLSSNLGSLLDTSYRCHMLQNVKSSRVS